VEGVIVGNDVAVPPLVSRGVGLGEIADKGSREALLGRLADDSLAVREGAIFATPRSTSRMPRTDSPDEVASD
jgi:hypothetical protein